MPTGPATERAATARTPPRRAAPSSPNRPSSPNSPLLRSRWLIGIAVAALAAALVFFLIALIVSEIECDPDQLDTVQCDDERAGAWGTVRGLLVTAIILGLLPAAAIAISRRRWTPLVLYATLAPLAALSYFGIGGIEVADHSAPKLTRANLLAPGCSLSTEPRCEDGVPVELSVTEPAEVVFSIGFADASMFKDRTFESSLVGEKPDSGSRAYSFEPGSHEVRVVTEVVRTGPLSPPNSLGSWPPGTYELTMTIEPADGGTEATEDERFERRFVVRP